MATVAMLLAAVPASATVAFREHYTDDYTFEFECPSGEVLAVVGHAEGTAHIRVGKGRFESAFFAHDNFAFREVAINGSGESLILEANGLFQETRATSLGGTLFTFTSVVAGQPFTVSDPDGNVLVRDRGSIRETIVFDTTGDDEPGGIFIESVDFQVNGPHDGLSFDFCDYLG